jgi:hypothetical protein
MDHYIDRKPIHIKQTYSGLDLDVFDNIFFLTVLRTDSYNIIKHYCEKINFELTSDDNWIFTVNQPIILKYFFEYISYKKQYQTRMNRVLSTLHRRNHKLAELELILIMSNGQDIYNPNADFKEFSVFLEEKKRNEAKIFELENKYNEYKNNHYIIKQNPNSYQAFLLASEFFRLFKPNDDILLL